MKNVFGVEWFNKQEDFDEAIAKVEAMLKDGEESSIVYIASEHETCHEVLAKGMFIPQPNQTKLVPTVAFNETLMTLLQIEYKKKSLNKLTA